MTDDVALTRAYLKHSDRPANWEDFSTDKLQNNRPISQSSAQNCTCKCFTHKNRAANVTTRYAPKHGSVARCEYIGCDCVEYRPVLPKGVRAHNWIVEQGS